MAKLRYIHESPIYYSQMANAEDPAATCNLTSAAMVLQSLSVPQKTNGRYPDELIDYCQAIGVDRETPGGIAQIINDYGKGYGVSDTPHTEGTWADLLAHVTEGNLAIVHGYFTNSGHIIVVIGVILGNDGYPESWIVNDPYGEWFEDGYDVNEPASPRKGKNKLYSDDMMHRCGGEDGDLWWHQIIVA